MIALAIVASLGFLTLLVTCIAVLSFVLGIHEPPDTTLTPFENAELFTRDSSLPITRER